MVNNAVGWFEIYVDDIARAKQFYETVFATKLEQLAVPGDYNMEMWAFAADMEKYGASGALAKMDGMSPGDNSTLVYFSCEDCAIEESRVESAGGRVGQSKASIGEYGFCSLVFDTEGNMFGLHSMQ